MSSNSLNGRITVHHAGAKMVARNPVVTLVAKGLSIILPWFRFPLNTFLARFFSGLVARTHGCSLVSTNTVPSSWFKFFLETVFGKVFF